MKKNKFNTFKLINVKFLMLIATVYQVGMLAATLVCEGGTISTLDWNTRDWPTPVNASTAFNDYTSTLLHTETNVGGVDFTFDFSSNRSDAILQRSFENYAQSNNAGDSDSVDDTATIVGLGGGDEGLAVVNPSDLTGAAISLDVIYTIVATNNSGLSSANGATVVDTLPSWAQGVTWTCALPTGGAICPNGNGSGGINETIATFPS